MNLRRYINATHGKVVSSRYKDRAAPGALSFPCVYLISLFSSVFVVFFEVNMLAPVFALTCALYVVGSLADTALGTEFALNASSLPTLKLPYGTWRAASYDTTNDVRTQPFSNEEVHFFSQSRSLLILFYEDQSADICARSTPSKVSASLLLLLVTCDGPNPLHRLRMTRFKMEAKGMHVPKELSLGQRAQVSNVSKPLDYLQCCMCALLMRLNISSGRL